MANYINGNLYPNGNVKISNNKRYINSVLQFGSELQKKLDTLTAGKKSSWEEEAKYRQANREWLRHSRKIAIKINRHLKDNGMQKQELATLLEVSPQQVSKIVKGQENLTLETIVKIESLLKITILNKTI